MAGTVSSPIVHSQLTGSITHVSLCLELKNFLLLRHKGDPIYSKPVQLSEVGFADRQESWCIEVTPHEIVRSGDAETAYLGLYVRMLNSTTEKIPGLFSLS